MVAELQQSSQLPNWDARSGSSQDCEAAEEDKVHAAGDAGSYDHVMDEMEAEPSDALEAEPCAHVVAPSGAMEAVPLYAAEAAPYGVEVGVLSSNVVEVGPSCVVVAAPSGVVVADPFHFVVEAAPSLLYVVAIYARVHGHDADTPNHEGPTPTPTPTPTGAFLHESWHDQSNGWARPARQSFPCSCLSADP